MLIIDESKISETIFKSNHTTVYKYVDDEEFILKTLDVSTSDQSSLVDFNLEFDILENLGVPAVPKPVSKARFKNNPALIYKYIPGGELSLQIRQEMGG